MNDQTPDDAARAERTPPLPTRDEVGDVLADAGIVRREHVFERVVEADLTYLTRALAPLFADFDREVRADERAQIAARRDEVAEAIAVHTPELVNEGPNGEDDGQHLYCVQCGVLPVDGLGLQYGPEHVADAVLAALGVDRG